MKIIIFGSGEIGGQIAEAFFEEHDITVIDRAERLLVNVNKLDLSVIAGNAADIRVLEEAGIKNADLFIACSHSDEANIIAALTAKLISNVKTMCFISNKEYYESLKMAKESEYEAFNIDKVVWLQELLTQDIVRVLTVPIAIDVEVFLDGRANLMEYKIEENSALCRKVIRDCQFPPEVLILGITRNNSLFIPNGNTELQPEDRVIFMGKTGSLEALINKFFRKAAAKVRSVLILGGGTMGYLLAKALEDIGLHAKLIEADEERCRFLAADLTSTLVICGDGTDLKLLQEEEAGYCDVAVCLTDSDEKNLLCSLFSKKLGVEKVIARALKSTNIDTFERAGIDIVISPRDAVLNSVRNGFLNQDGSILLSVGKGQGEILRLKVPAALAGEPIKNLRIPGNGLIAAVEHRKKAVIPNGETKLSKGDSVIVFSMRENSDAVLDYFSEAADV